jgi:hypothetical protein
LEELGHWQWILAENELFVTVEIGGLLKTESEKGRNFVVWRRGAPTHSHKTATTAMVAGGRNSSFQQI